MGWKRYLGLDYVDYTDQIFQSLIKTRYAKKQFSLILSLMITFVVRWHIRIVVGYLFSFHPIVDFCVQVALSVFLVLKSGWIHNLVTRFQTEIYALSRYLINNYTPEHYRVWKRTATVGVCVYLLVYLFFVEVTSALLMEYVLQFLVSYFIVDGCEEGTFMRWWEWFYTRYAIHTRKSSTPLYIQDDYLEKCRSEEDNENKEVEGTLQKSWMLLENVSVIEDFPSHSVVVFQEFNPSDF